MYRALQALTLLAAALSAAVHTALGDNTIRIGEQDTCDITGVTTISYDSAAKAGLIRFDLAKLPKDARCVCATLRFWINGFTDHRQWGFGRWGEADFDGFKVYAGKAAEGQPLDTKYPFNLSTWWLFELDVTSAVKVWLADPTKNEGLAANFAFPADTDRRAVEPWMRPHLQITLAGPNANRPAQPTELEAACRHGQVFITWKQKPHKGAFFDSTYRVYRHTEPIAAANLDKAQLLGEVHRLSQLNARRTMVARGGGYCQQHLYAEAAGVAGKEPNESNAAYWDRQRQSIPQRFNYVIDHDWAEKIDGGKWLAEPPADKEKVTIRGGPQLSDDTGLFVYTVSADGKAFYAVTSVIEGNENRDDFGKGNALTAPAQEQKDTPRPVLQAVFFSNMGSHWNIWQIRDLAYWEGGDGRFHNTPSTALNCTMDVNKSWAGLAPKAEHPIWILSHAQLSGYSTHYGSGSGSRLYDKAGVTMDTYYMPPTPQAPFPNASSGPNVNWPEYGMFYYGTAEPPSRTSPFGADERGFYPYHRAHGMYGYMDTIQTGRDSRKATAVPYWENRRLFEVQSLLATFPQADPDNIVVAGQWGGLAFGIHHADAFGCINSTMESNWRTQRGGTGTFELVGPEKWGLKNPEGFNVWDWNDPIWYSRKFPRKQWPYVTHVISGNYDGVGTWGNMGYPQFYFGFAAENWKASDGAAISANGLFSADKPGEYKVTATAGGKTDTVTVSVKGNAFVEDFDDEVADGWTVAGEDSWDDKDKADWYVWRKGTGWMGTLLQTAGSWAKKPDRSGHLFIYEAGRPWGDVTVTADRLPGRLETAQGVIFRYQDAKDYYRFEKTAGKGPDGKPAMLLRLVKVAGGEETVLASAEMDVPLLTIEDPAKHRTFQHWGAGNLAQLKRSAETKPIEFDRFRVEACGGKFKALLNGKETLSAEDGQFETGAVGL